MPTTKFVHYVQWERVVGDGGVFRPVHKQPDIRGATRGHESIPLDMQEPSRSETGQKHTARQEESDKVYIEEGNSTPSASTNSSDSLLPSPTPKSKPHPNIPIMKKKRKNAREHPTPEAIQLELGLEKSQIERLDMMLRTRMTEVSLLGVVAWKSRTAADREMLAKWKAVLEEVKNNFLWVIDENVPLHRVDKLLKIRAQYLNQKHMWQQKTPVEVMRSKIVGKDAGTVKGKGHGEEAGKRREVGDGELPEYYRDLVFNPASTARMPRLRSAIANTRSQIPQALDATTIPDTDNTSESEAEEQDVLGYMPEPVPTRRWLRSNTAASNLLAYASNPSRKRSLSDAEKASTPDAATNNVSNANITNLPIAVDATNVPDANNTLIPKAANSPRRSATISRGTGRSVRRTTRMSVDVPQQSANIPQPSTNTPQHSPLVTKLILIENKYCTLRLELEDNRDRQNILLEKVVDGDLTLRPVEHKTLVDLQSRYGEIIRQRRLYYREKEEMLKVTTNEEVKEYSERSKAELIDVQKLLGGGQVNVG